MNIGQVTGAGETFAGLYEEHLSRVFRYVQYRVNDSQVAEDLTSATFEKALVNFNRFQGDRASFSTWVLTIARNVVIDHYRARGRRHTVPIDEACDVPAGGDSPEQQLEKKDELRRLHVCLAGLPDADRELISLKFGAELNNRDIARLTGLTESNVGTKLCRLVKRLRDRFQDVQ